MIVLNLSCEQGHHFEGWFPSSEAFENQCQRSLVSCTVCASTEITRLPSSPRISKGATEPIETKVTTGPTKEAVATVLNAIAKIASECENVDQDFPDEVRKIHYGETAPRNIRGIATVEETLEMLEEGIPLLPLPVPPKGETH